VLLIIAIFAPTTLFLCDLPDGAVVYRTFKYNLHRHAGHHADNLFGAPAMFTDVSDISYVLH
jgi:hypothetical protein